MSMLEFIYEAHPARVVFSPGARTQLAHEVRHLGIGRALVLASPRLADEARARMGDLAVHWLHDAVMHVPREVADAARATAKDVNADGLVAIGGGSTLGLAKAIALETGLPILAVPTTFSGSEMTSVWGITEGGKKRTGRDPRVRPRTVIYDPELTRTLPPRAAGTSGLNAVAHAMEALYARVLDPITLMFAEESVRSLGRSLPRIAGLDVESQRAPTELGAHADALYGAWLAGVCLDRATMGVHHKLCHVLGGSFGLPHAEVHSVILPHAAAYNRAAAPEAMQRLVGALGGTDAPTALFALAERVGAPGSLAELGMKEADLDRAAALASENPYDNPRPVTLASLRALLDDAFHGRAPAA
jgi:maleylacetate reductase